MNASMNDSHNIGIFLFDTYSVTRSSRCVSVEVGIRPPRLGGPDLVKDGKLHLPFYIDAMLT